MLDIEMLWKISGGDYFVIKVCDLNIQKKFAFVGGIVVLISILCFVSAYYTLSVIFNNFLLSIPIGLFFSWMITNIYIVLLTTLQKNLLPHNQTKGSKLFSLTIRIAFIVFIATLISKPIEVVFFKRDIRNEIEALKSKIIQNYLAKSNKHYHKEETRVLNELKSIQEIQKMGFDMSESINTQYSILNQILAEKKERINNMEFICRHSNYFLEEMKVLSTSRNYFYSWIVTILIIIIFLLPAILKYYISETSSYYARKAKIEKDIIEEHYNKTKIIFTELLYAVRGKNIHIEEKYSDPPFNTIPLVEVRNFSEEKDFLDIIYRA